MYTDSQANLVEGLGSVYVGPKNELVYNPPGIVIDDVNGGLTFLL